MTAKGLCPSKLEGPEKEIQFAVVARLDFGPWEEGAALSVQDGLSCLPRERWPLSSAEQTQQLLVTKT